MRPLYWLWSEIDFLICFLALILVSEGHPGGEFWLIALATFKSLLKSHRRLAARTSPLFAMLCRRCGEDKAADKFSDVKIDGHPVCQKCFDDFFRKEWREMTLFFRI